MHQNDSFRSYRRQDLHNDPIQIQKVPLLQLSFLHSLEEPLPYTPQTAPRRYPYMAWIRRERRFHPLLKPSLPLQQETARNQKR